MNTTPGVLNTATQYVLKEKRLAPYMVGFLRAESIVTRTFALFILVLIIIIAFVSVSFEFFVPESIVYKKKETRTFYVEQQKSHLDRPQSFRDDLKALRNLALRNLTLWLTM